MANVTLSIGGRSFTLACDDGEEAHVTSLGKLIDEKAAASGAVGQTEPRMLLFASLMMADELIALRKRPISGEFPPEIAERLARIADHVENLASRLEDETTNA